MFNFFEVYFLCFNLIWPFEKATSITFNNVGWEGSCFAPNADIINPQGVSALLYSGNWTFLGDSRPNILQIFRSDQRFFVHGTGLVSIHRNQSHLLIQYIEGWSILVSFKFGVQPLLQFFEDTISKLVFLSLRPRSDLPSGHETFKVILCKLMPKGNVIIQYGRTTTHRSYPSLFGSMQKMLL